MPIHCTPLRRAPGAWRVANTALVALTLAPMVTPVPLQAAEPADATPPAIVFTACPIYRDTDHGRKSGCWLADDPMTGQRYDVSDASTKPWLGHQVLVEGWPSPHSDVCGGLPLHPVRVSVLPQRCPERFIGPEGYPSKPSVLPTQIVPPLTQPRAPLAPPYAVQVIEVFFDLGSDFFNYQDADTLVEKAAYYALQSHARHIQVQGFADTIGTTHQGHTLNEPAAMATARRDKVIRALAGYGVAAARIAPVPPGAPPAAVPAPFQRRKVTITITP